MTGGIIRRGTQTRDAKRGETILKARRFSIGGMEAEPVKARSGRAFLFCNASTSISMAGPGIRGGKNRGGKQSAAYPGLPGLGHSVAAEKWEIQPSLAIEFAG